MSVLDERNAVWAFVGTAVTGLLALLASWWKRRDTTEEREAAERARREAISYDRLQAELGRCWKRVGDMEADIARERAETARERAERERVEADRDHGWDKARALYGIAHDARHKHVNTIQAAVSGKATADELMAREPPPIPPFAEIGRKEAS